MNPSPLLISCKPFPFRSDGLDQLKKDCNNTFQSYLSNCCILLEEATGNHSRVKDGIKSLARLTGADLLVGKNLVQAWSPLNLSILAVACTNQIETDSKIKMTATLGNELCVCIVLNIAFNARSCQ